MKILSFIVLVLVGTALIGPFSPKGASVHILPNSELLINGKTNINQFRCGFDMEQLKRPIELEYRLEKNKMVFKHADLVLRNTCFDCGNKGINRDFLELLKSDSHPEIQLSLLSLERTQEGDSLKATLKIALAGKSNRYVINVARQPKGKEIMVEGDIKLNIRDFGLEPPKKVLGFITVSEIIEIDLNLALAFQ